MATISIEIEVETSDTVADLLEQLGGIPPERVLLKPAPGTATIMDATAILEGPRKRICELIGGTLVEKAMGTQESSLALSISFFIKLFLRENPLGMLQGPDGYVRVDTDTFRAPDISFISWKRLAEDRVPATPVLRLAPELAIEILSPSNTKKEMTRKIKELFLAGAKEIWLIQPKNQTAEIYTSPRKMRRIASAGVLECARILPGFRLTMKELFDDLIRPKP